MLSSSRNIIPLLMIAAALWALIGFVRPRYSSLQNLQVEKEDYQQALKNANEARIIRNRLLATYDSFSKEHWDRLKKMLPAEARGVELARDISGIATIFDISLDSFDFAAGASVAAQPAFVSPPSSLEGDPSSGNPPSPSFAVPTEQAIFQEVLEISFSFQTDYANFMRFLRELEGSLELTDIKSLSISRSSGKEGKASDVPLYSFTITGHTYWVK